MYPMRRPGAMLLEVLFDVITWSGAKAATGGGASSSRKP